MPCFDLFFGSMYRVDAANTTSNHDGLVIAATYTFKCLLKYSEITAQNWATKFIIECGAT